jgi:ribose 5-phosphate isomerase B
VKIALGSDHAGFALKETIKSLLVREGYDVTDAGAFSEASVDYSDYGFPVARMVAGGEAERGILVCGTGIGMSVVANRVPGVRAALVTDVYVAEQSRRHLDANMLVLGGRVTGPGLAEAIVRVWLATPFEGGRHQGRINKIDGR